MTFAEEDLGRIRMCPPRAVTAPVPTIEETR